MVERALELNRLLQAKIKAELDRIEELIAANQRMQSRLDLLIKDAAVVHKATRYRMATFFVSLDKSVCCHKGFRTSTQHHHCSAPKMNRSRQRTRTQPRSMLTPPRCFVPAANVCGNHKKQQRERERCSSQRDKAQRWAEQGHRRSWRRCGWESSARRARRC